MYVSYGYMYVPMHTYICIALPLLALYTAISLAMYLHITGGKLPLEVPVKYKFIKMKLTKPRC